MMLRLLLILWLIHSILPAKGQDTIRWIRSSQLEKEGYYQNFGFTKAPVKIGIINDNESSNGVHYLKLNNPHANSILLKDKQGNIIVKTGDYLPFASRPVYFWDFVIPLPPTSSTNDSLTLTIDNSAETLVFFLEVLNQRNFEKVKSRSTFLYGGLLAYAIFFAGMFITLGLFKKNPTHFLFGGFIILSMLWIFNIEGVLYQFFWSENVFFQHASRVFFSSLSIGCFVLYFMYYYDKHIHPVAKKIFTAFVVFFLIRMTVVLTIPEIRINPGLKYMLLLIGTITIIAGLALLMIYLLILFRKRDLLYHNIGTAICFLFILNEGLRLTGIDVIPFLKKNEYTSVFSLVFILTAISVDNLQTYRRQKKLQSEKLFEDTRRRDKETSDRILAAQENERSSIAKNIHDQIGGLLAAMKIQLETLRVQNKEIGVGDSEKLIRLVDHCSNELYAIVDDLSAPEFQEQELSFIIQNRISLYEQSTGIYFEYEPCILSLDIPRGLNIYRIVCELIANSIRHANCEKISLRLQKNDHQIHIHYSDDGVGFDIAKVSRHHGLQNIKSRIGFMNGEMNIESRPGRTVFTIRIPIA